MKKIYNHDIISPLTPFKHIDLTGVSHFIEVNARFEVTSINQSFVLLKECTEGFTISLPMSDILQSWAIH